MHRKQFDQAFDQVAEFFKILSNPSRIKIVGLLLKSKMDVNEISKTIGISQSSVSQHLKILRYHHLVKEKREGKHVYYSIINSALSNVIEDVFNFYSNNYMNSNDNINKIIELSSVWKDQVKHEC
ncbi:MAG: metalloregulator ArsR/SmtB family transcription factor [Cyanobacteriota bacterium]